MQPLNSLWKIICPNMILRNKWAIYTVWNSNGGQNEVHTGPSALCSPQLPACFGSGLSCPEYNQDPPEHCHSSLCVGDNTCLHECIWTVVWHKPTTNVRPFYVGKWQTDDESNSTFHVNSMCCSLRFYSRILFLVWIYTPTYSSIVMGHLICLIFIPEHQKGLCCMF